MLIVFDDMIADMISNKKLDPIVIEPIAFYIRGGKLIISVDFITQPHVAISKICD